LLKTLLEFGEFPPLERQLLDAWTGYKVSMGDIMAINLTAKLSLKA
jgi:hypothetical protein